ncbi:hypothetical protein [Reyranella sp. CPCC 100927]|nr:hypothetical protein [Reyranella sp. CPCC 100927]
MTLADNNGDTPAMSTSPPTWSPGEPLLPGKFVTGEQKGTP